MAFPAILAAIIPLIDKIIPDKGAAAEAKLKVLEMQQAGEFKYIDADLTIAQQQTEINKVEAASPDPFKSGWRPFIGWVCGSACAWNWIGLSMAKFLIVLLGVSVDVSLLEPASLEEMLPVLTCMLGLGGYRTFEKLKGVHK